MKKSTPLAERGELGQKKELADGRPVVASSSVSRVMNPARSPGPTNAPGAGIVGGVVESKVMLKVRAVELREVLMLVMS
jgi:hypothetical protein